MVTQRARVSLVQGVFRCVWGVAAAVFLLLASVTSADWYRGNTHCHSLWSDGNEFPEMVADWYKTNGYDFVVLSDHNAIAEGERWRNVAGLDRKHGLIGKCRARFGDDAVQTRRAGSKLEVLLSPLEVLRKRVEEPGRFVVLNGVEITGKCGELPVHVNAVNVEHVLLPVEGDTVVDCLDGDMAVILREAQCTKRPIFSQVNHPNWRYAVSAFDLGRVHNAVAVEIVNAAGGSNLAGDATHPDCEQLWDLANAIRLLRERWQPLWGVAADDAHHYHMMQDTHMNPGRGWIVVQADALTADALTEAMARGDFYASTGVTLKTLTYDATAGTLEVEVQPAEGIEYRIDFVGVAADAALPRGATVGGAASGEMASPSLSTEFSTVVGTRARYRLGGKELFVRAVVTDTTTPPHRYGLDTITRRAWTQPVGWRRGR